jgi:hypothetical protein
MTSPSSNRFNEVLRASMTIDVLNRLLAERRETRSLLEQWTRLRWSPLEADEIAKRLAVVVYRPLAHISSRERLSFATVASVMLAAQAKTTTSDARDWQDALFDSREINRDIIRRIGELVSPFEDIVHEVMA